MYQSLRLPWSPHPSTAELAYRQASPHTVRTKGTIFLPPPPDDVLRQAFHAPPRPQSRMSAGAVALTKHFERNPKPVKHPRMPRDEAKEHGDEEAAGSADAGTAAEPEDRANRHSKTGGDGYKFDKRKEGETHPFWAVPTGSNEEKTRLAGETLERMLEHAKWRNVMLLHEGVAVYEVRMGRGWGMRWTLALAKEETRMAGKGPEEEGKEGPESDMPGWTIGKVTFRGFLEPIAGLDHELDTEHDPQLESAVGTET